MIAALRTLCLALAALLGAFAVPARAAEAPGIGERSCCATHEVGVAAAAELGGAAAPSAAHRGCCCGTACHCTPTAPQRDCDCAKKSPQPTPQPAEPALPKPPPAGSAVVGVRRVQQVPPDLTTAAKLRAAMASGLPHVLLPGRSRQVALSVWLC